MVSHPTKLPCVCSKYWVSHYPSRTRKIRCDGAKPVCHNCSRRTNASSECNYDPIPKRRGPDKTPGARQRAAREMEAAINGPAPRRRRRATTNTDPYPKNYHEQQTPSQPSDPSPTFTDPRTTRISLEPASVSPQSFSNNSNFVDNSDYSPVPYTCGCHGVIQCPSLLGAQSISNSQRSDPVVRCLRALNLL